MNEFDTSDVSRNKRAVFPDSFGKNCPECGDPFDAGSSGFLSVGGGGSTECISWVRLCVIEDAAGEWGWLPQRDDTSVFAVIHKDEHV